MRVLLMSDGLEATLACIQSLGRLGHTIVVATGAVPTATAYSSYVAKRVRPSLADGKPETKVAALVRMVAEESIDVVIPLHDDDARIVARAKQHFPRIKAFVVSSEESVAIAGDKIATFQMANELGIPTPPSLIVETPSDIPSAVAHFGLPAFVKMPVATASRGTFMVQTRGEAKKLAERLEGRMIVQEKIEGDFVGITGFADRGELLEHFAFRVPAAVRTAGTPAYALSFDAQGLREMLETICRRLEWTGGIDIDAVLAPGDDLYLLETNPRFSGTLVFADKLGIDLPRYYADHVAGAGYAARAPRPAANMLFVSVDVEAGATAAARKLGRFLKRQYQHVDSRYPEDAGLNTAKSTAGQFGRTR